MSKIYPRLTKEEVMRLKTGDIIFCKYFHKDKYYLVKVENNGDKIFAGGIRIDNKLSNKDFIARKPKYCLYCGEVITDFKREYFCCREHFLLNRRRGQDAKVGAVIKQYYEGKNGKNEINLDELQGLANVSKKKIARIVHKEGYSKKVQHERPYGAAKVDCEHYLKCLDKSARNGNVFKCDNCLKYKFSPYVITNEEINGYFRLLFAIFYEKEWDMRTVGVCDPTSFTPKRFENFLKYFGRSELL